MSAVIARQSTRNYTSLRPLTAKAPLLVLVLFTTEPPAATIHATRSIVDDYSPTSVYSSWYYSRMGTDRGEMGDGNYQVTIGGSSATVRVTSGWAGVWTSLMHGAADTADSLVPTQLLGPYVRPAFQPWITGVEVTISNGSGAFKLEIKNSAQTILHQKTFQLSGGPQVLRFDFSPTQLLKLLNWLVDGPGSATVDEIKLVLGGPTLPTREAMFLFSYGHLSQCYDPVTGLVGDRANYWPATDYTAVPAIGMFALVSAVAYQRGYIDQQSAASIVAKTRATLTSIPRMHGLLPHFLKNGNISPGTEWSSIDTSIALVSSILASQFVGQDTSALEAMLRQIDWSDLTDGFTRSISHGYKQDGTKIPNRWDTFGGESFLLAVAFSAANPNVKFPRVESYPQVPTWDGSGFDDEISALFFPMTGEDYLMNDWDAYRQAAFLKQVSYFSAIPRYSRPGLFGLSASEVPEPWTISDPKKIYGAWGVGGHNEQVNDGSSLVGYPIIAPHYAAMISKEHPASAEALFEYLAARNLFSPLNNVESFGITTAGVVRWNDLKGSWNLTLQTLGAGRSLSGFNYAPYTALAANAFLNNGYQPLINYCSLCLPSRGSWRALLKNN